MPSGRQNTRSRKVPSQGLSDPRATPMKTPYTATFRGVPDLMLARIWVSCMSLMVVLGSGQAADTLVIQRPGNYQVVQRVRGKADVPLILPTPLGGKVEARVLKDKQMVLDWQACGVARPNEPFNGMIRGVPEGGWYTVDVRVTDDHQQVLADGHVDHVGIGIVIGVIGQSNASGYSGGPPYAIPHPLTSVFRPCGLFEPLMDPVCQPGPQAPLTDAQKADPSLQPYVNPSPEFKQKTYSYLDWGCSASCWPEFSRLLAEQYGVPVMIVPGARRAAYSSEWLPTHAAGLYSNMVKQVRLAGGCLSAMIVNQGESDCDLKEKSGKTWISNTRAYVRAFRQDLAAPDLPFFFVQIGMYNSWAPLVRDATDRFTMEEPGCYLGAYSFEFKPGGIHYTKAGMTTLAWRLASAYRHVVGGETQVVYQGPHAVSAKWLADRKVVKITFDCPLVSTNIIAGLEIVADKDTMPLAPLLSGSKEEWEAMVVNAFSAMHEKYRVNMSDDGKRLTVDPGRVLPEGSARIVVRYGWRNSTQWINLRSRDEPGLPVYPFEFELNLK